MSFAYRLICQLQWRLAFVYSCVVVTSTGSGARCSVSILTTYQLSDPFVSDFATLSLGFPMSEIGKKKKTTQPFYCISMKTEAESGWWLLQCRTCMCWESVNGSCAYGDSLGSVRKWDFIAESSPFSSHLFFGGWVWGTTMSGYTFFSHSYYLKC